MRSSEEIEAEAATSFEPAGAGEGFVLDEIEMRGFMRYVEKTDPPIRFPEKFTVITGRTGAGKSSILDAITFALYGSTTRTDIQTVKTADVCRPGGYVRVGFRQGESRWEVRRGFTTKKDSYLEVSRDGEAISGTIREKEQTVQDVVGLDYTGFRNSTFVRQEEMKELGAARGADRLAVFQKLFRLEVFERALQRAKEEQVSLQSDLRAKDADIAARTESLLRLPPARQELEAARRDLAAGSLQVAALEGKLRAAEEDLRRKEAEHEAWVRINAAIEDRHRQVDALGRRMEETRQQGTQSEELRKELETLEEEAADLDAVREELDGSKERQQIHERVRLAAETAERIFDQAKKDHERRRDQIKDKMDALHRKLAGLGTELDRDGAFNLVRDEGRLEERVARIERELEWLADRADTVRLLQEERARTEKALAHIHEKVGSIDQDSFVLTELRSQVEELRADLKREADESHETLQGLDDAKITALRELDANPFTERDRRHVEDLTRAVHEKGVKRRKADEIGARLKALGDPAALLADQNRQLGAVEAELASLESEDHGLRIKETAYEAAKSDLEAIRAALDTERRAFHTREGQAKQLHAQIEGLEADASRLKEAERLRDELRLRGEIVDILVNRIFHNRGVVMYAIDQLLPELEIEASKNLAELTDGRFSRIKLATYEEGRGHGIRIQVQGVDGLWHDVGEFSGGEKTQINAALRFAIARELASLPQLGRTFGRMKTLFIDEGDLGSLDTEVSRELFVQKLFRMGEFFEKVILITHLAEVADRFPSRLRVTMTPTQESRVEVLA
ncbi:MAG TPA: SMC family ATPase [Thermoplasmata archaeon]|nr:SMC family ATPase [Thermoplasmata archaeon]